MEQYTTQKKLSTFNSCLSRERYKSGILNNSYYSKVLYNNILITYIISYNNHKWIQNIKIDAI